MKTYDLAHRAAKEVHESLGAEKDFRYWGDPERYLEAGLIVRKPKRNTSGFEYYPITDDLWYIFDSSGARSTARLKPKAKPSTSWAKIVHPMRTPGSIR